MNYATYELRPLYTGQKSFYGKAVVVSAIVNSDRYYTLQSYNTAVVSVYVGCAGTPFVKKLWSGYSATTMRHINELLMQLGFPKLPARVWSAMGVGKFYHPDEIPALDVFTR